MEGADRKIIAELRALGYGYKRIATELGMSVNTIKSYCRRNKTPELQRHTCKECGVVVSQTIHRKRKLFCSDFCRMVWWRKQKKQRGSKTTICLNCKSEFLGYESQNRKFCSRGCYYAFKRKENENG